MSNNIPGNRVSLRDIAKRLGISHSTVSLALRNHPRISEKVRLQIHATAAEMGYRPDPMLAALAHYRQSKTTIPVRAAIAWLNFWPDPAQLYRYQEFRLYWKGATEAAEKFGYHLEEFTLKDKMQISRLEHILRTRSISGIMIPPQPQTPDWGDFQWEHFSAVRFGRSCRRPNLHLVTADQVSNTMLAFEKIQERGYKRIGFITGHGSKRGILFKAGFLMAQSDLAESLRVPVLIFDEPTGPETRRATDAANQRRLEAWVKQTRPDAILTDITEVRAMVEKAGYRVPEDIGIAVETILDGGADSGIFQNPEEIGRAAFLLVLSLIHDNDRGIPQVFRQILVSGQWVDGTTLPQR